MKECVSTKGISHPIFVTDADRMETVLENPYILFVSSKISAVRDVVPVLEKVMQSGKPLLIIAKISKVKHWLLS